MKILFINPSVRPDSPKCLLNVGLAYVASAVDGAGFDLEILDIDAHRFSPQEVERQIRTKKFDVVGIGTLVSQYKWTKEIAATIKQYHPHAQIMVGNTLGTSVASILLEKTDVDIAVLGEGDVTAVEVLRALNEDRPLDEVQGICFKRDGRAIRTPGRPVIPNIDRIPSPNYDLFEMEIYLGKSKWLVPAPETLSIAFDELVVMPVSTARGCPFSCNFCFHAFQEQKYRFRSPENIADEVELWKTKYGANFIAFWDELSFYHPKATERLADLFIEGNLGIHFTASCRSELLNWDTIHVAEKLKKAGCKGLSFALENGNEEILKAMNKRNYVGDFITQAKVCHAVGIEVYTSLVFGYPQETLETIAETYRVLQEARVYGSVGYLQPMPGTPMYEYAKRTGHITADESYLLIMGDRQDLKVNLSKLSSEEMEAAVYEHCVELNKVLDVGLKENELIKTRTYRVAKAESFLESFGVAAQVVRESDNPGC
jgi:radical SAM superfamily enzyme YgiQ (UPF0313 family)